MTLKVKVVYANEVGDLETPVNEFLADKDPDNVLDIRWLECKRGENDEAACCITYQE